MIPYFNTTGPCIPGEHYMLPPERRLGRVMELIEDGRYFTLQAGRQTGKTTSARWLAAHYTGGQRYRAIWVDLQIAREQPDPAAAFRTVLDNFDMAVERTLPELGVPAARARLLENPEHRGGQVPCSGPVRPLPPPSRRPHRRGRRARRGRDGLVPHPAPGGLHRSRAHPFPHSIALIGARAVRDFVFTQEERRTVAWLGTTSPFNITAEAAALGPFPPDEVERLLAQHTAVTGQRFEPEAAARIYDLSQGHPWLVNALADRIVERDLRDRSVAVTAAHVDAAKEAIIVERRTHIDSLMARLREPRVRRIVDPMLAGTALPVDLLDDDVAYLLGLGLLRVVRGEYVIANPIYREVIPRALTNVQQHGMHQPTEWYVTPDGALDMGKLMSAFQAYWREHGHLAAEGFGYRESGPHLMLMTFLQRVVNGGGRIEREYGLGRGALDLMVEWRGKRHVIEVKLRRHTQTEAAAREQVLRYLDAVGLDEGWLVIFDLRAKKSWKERLTQRTVKKAGKRVHVVGC